MYYSMIYSSRCCIFSSVIVSWAAVMGGSDELEGEKARTGIPDDFGEGKKR